MLILNIQSLTWKEAIPLLSPIIVVILFIIERCLSYNNRKREIERTWYYKILIDPSITKLNYFFNDVKEIYIASCTTLLASQKKQHQTYISLKSSEIGKFQSVKRSFELDIVTPILHRYPEVGKKLQNYLLELEDLFSNNIDSGLFSDDNKESFFHSLFNLKSQWLNTLYDPIK